MFTVNKRRKFDAEFREGAVRIAAGTGKAIAQVAKDLGINETTLASWVSRQGSSESLGFGVITELLRVGHQTGDGPCSATSEAPGLLIEMSDVSTTLLGGLVGHLSCRTRPAACARGMSDHARRHP